MSYARQMLDTYLSTFRADQDVLGAVIDALTDCAQACTANVSADLSEPELAEMVRCIRLCLDCADICAASAAVVSRQAPFDPGVIRPLLEACAASCRSCGDECEHHAARHAHCRVCAEACRRCERACWDLLGRLT